MSASCSARAVRVARHRDGSTGYDVALPPDDLPPVRARDLQAAWDAAHAAADAAQWDLPRLFRFQPPANAAPQEPATELLLADGDACCWAGAVERTLGLSSAYGISVCLRLLSLVDLMARAPWTGAWFALRRDGAAIEPPLLRAAAAVPLTRQGGLDEFSLRARLDAADRHGQTVAADRRLATVAQPS